MATLTIRNLPEDVHDRLRRAAAENHRSMEEEVRQALAARYSKQISTEEIIRRLDQLSADKPRQAQAKKMLASEFLIAGRRVEALYEAGLISRAERMSWDERIAQDDVTLDEVERFAAEKRNCQTKAS
jgi:plasmid stability protein